jgi:ABC-type branched-subunit amino acid transport system substrate-binding protein
MRMRPAALFAAAVAAFAPTAHAAQGVSDTTVAFGQVAVLDGPAAALGLGMREGILAAFAEANAKGGVHGRTLTLDSRDDGYEPDLSAQHVRAFVAEDSVIGLLGPVGTPTALAAQPIATEAGMPYVGPFTGAGFLRNAALGNVFNLRASYAAETEMWIRHLVDEKGLKTIAILYQDDGFGRSGLEGVTAALERRGMTLAAEGAFTRNTVAVRSALLEIRRAEPDAVVMVGPYKPMAEFIRLSKSLNFTPTFVNISFVGSDALAAELGPDGAGVIVSQVVPFPWDDSIPVVKAYHAALAAYAPDAKPGFVSLEGYLVGRLAIAALEKAGPTPTREGFLAALAGMGAHDLGGVTVGYGPGDNEGMDTVWMTRITPDGGFEPIPTGGPS